MTTLRVYYDANALWVDTIETPFVAGTLAAAMDQDGVTVHITRADGSYNFVSPPWADLADISGNKFQTPADVMTYLTAQFAMRRPVGETFGVATVAGADLVQGLPVAVSRATGQLLPARADTYTLAFVAGLAAVDTAQGFTCQPAHGAVTLDDWSALAGQSTLFAGVPYFLGAAGGLTVSPFATPGAYVTRIGLAVSPTTLVVNPSDPITL